MLRPCLDCGRPSPASYCAADTHARGRARGSRQQRGYDTAHDRMRRYAVATYHPTDPCGRCLLPLGDDPGLLDLGHTDDRRAWTGLEHRWCNRATARRHRHRGSSTAP